MFRPTLILAFAVCLGLCVGCKPGPQVPEKSSGSTTDSAARSDHDRESSPSPQFGDDPAAAVRSVLDGLNQRKLRSVWDFLPGSYQGDLQGLVRQFGDRMDPEIWGRVMGIVRRSATILRDRQEWLSTPAANTPAVKPAGGQELGPVDFAAVATLLDLLADSELGDLQRLRQVNLGAWCDQVGEPLLEQLQEFAERMPSDPLARTMTGLTELEVKSQPVKGDEATIEIIAPGESPVEIPYLKIDGRWIPRDLANSWIEAMGESRARLAVTLNEENLAAVKPQVLAGLGVFEEWLGRLEKAKSKDEFDFAWAQGVQNVLTVAATFAPTTAVEEAPDESATIPKVKVVIAGELSFDEQDAQLEKLAKLTDGGEGPFREISASNREVSITIGPVSDVVAFSRQIDFLAVSKVDAEARMIWATPKGAKTDVEEKR